MKRFFIGLFTLGFVITVSANVFAQTEEKKGTEGKRVIEEKILLKDPTVAEPKKWLIGGSFEYWYVSGDYTEFDSTGKKTAEGTIDGGMPGYNVSIGYDKFTLQYAYRPGDFDIDKKMTGTNVQTKLNQDQKEQEIVARYLFTTDKLFNFYVLAGYSNIKVKEIEDIITSGWVWTYNSKTRYSRTTEYNSALAGIGVIVPLTKSKDLGIRGDVRGMFTDAEWKRDDGRTVSGNGVGGGGTLTGYWNIYKGINLQVGGRAQFLNGGDVGWKYLGGAFASLGYAYRF